MLFAPLTYSQSSYHDTMIDHTLSLYDAIQYAMSHNETVLYSVEQSFLASEAQLRSAKAVYNPNLNANANMVRYFSRTKIQASDLSGNYYSTSYNQQILPGISLQQTFLTPFGSRLTAGAGIQTGMNGLSTFNYQTTPQFTLSYQQPLSLSGIEAGHADIISAKQSYSNSQMSYELQKEELALSVIQAYFQLWQSMRNEEQSERDFGSTKRVLEVAELKLKSGSIAEFEVINLRVQNRLSEDNLLQAQNDLRTQSISFFRLLGDPSYMSFSDTSINLDSEIPLDSVMISLDSTIFIALGNRIELKQSEIALEQSALGREQTASALSPVLQLQATYNLSSVYEPSFMNSITLLPNYGWGLQASVTVPLWDGGRTSANLEAADRTISVQKNNLELLKEDIAIDIENRYRTSALDLHRLKSLGLSLNAAAEAMKIAEVRFQSGQISSTEIEDIRNRYNTAQITLNLAKISYVLERAGLAKAMGEFFQWVETLRKTR
jgi:outer membrane protein